MSSAYGYAQTTTTTDTPPPTYFNNKYAIPKLDHDTVTSLKHFGGCTKPLSLFL